MQRRKVAVLGGVLLLALGAGGVWVVVTASWGSSNRYGDNDADAPDGVHFLCTSKTCGHGFTLTVKQFADHHADDATYGTPVKCPKCGADAGPAERCKTCGRNFPAVRSATATCPHCGKPVRPQGRARTR